MEKKYSIPAHPDLTRSDLFLNIDDDLPQVACGYNEIQPHLALSPLHLSSLYSNIAEDFEEIQKSFGLPKQGVAAQFSGVNVTLPKNSDKSIAYSQIPNPGNTGVKNPKSEKKSNEKKKLCDKAYRQRLRRQREKMENDLLMFGTENEDLESENGLLRSERDQMDQKLQARAAENKRLKSETCSLRGKISEQQVLVDALQRKLRPTNPGDDQQLINLRNENARLRQNVTWTGQMEEKKQLLDRRVDLERQRRLLQFQVQAICRTYKDKNIDEQRQA